MDREINRKKLQKIIRSLSLFYNLPEKDVEEIVFSQFEFMRDTIRELPLHDIEVEDLPNLKTNFSIKYIGKFYTDDKIINYKRRRNAGAKKFKQKGSRKTN